MINVLRRAAIIAACLAVAACQSPPFDAATAKPSAEVAAQDATQDAAQVDADLGLAALAKGDFAAAQNHILQALHTDPDNVYALLGSGLLYEATAKERRAEEAFQRILALNPPLSVRAALWPDMAPRPVVALAAERLAKLSRQPAVLAAAAARAGFTVTETAAPLAEIGPYPGLNSRLTPGLDPGLGTDLVDSERGFAAVLSRFTTLRTLLDAKLMTAQEYTRRRGANRGALLPLTAPPAAAGLTQPVPTTATVVDRLAAVAADLKRGAIGADQHARERTAILDGVLPAAPMVLASPAVPPRDLAQVEVAYFRLQAAERARLISAAEYRGERRALGRALDDDLDAADARRRAASTVTPITPAPTPTSLFR